MIAKLLFRIRVGGFEGGLNAPSLGRKTLVDSDSGPPAYHTGSPTAYTAPHWLDQDLLRPAAKSGTSQRCLAAWSAVQTEAPENAAHSAADAPWLAQAMYSK